MLCLWGRRFGRRWQFRRRRVLADNGWGEDQRSDSSVADATAAHVPVAGDAECSGSEFIVVAKSNPTDAGSAGQRATPSRAHSHANHRTICGRTSGNVRTTSGGGAVNNTDARR
jgi:hypothetical protein